MTLSFHFFYTQRYFFDDLSSYYFANTRKDTNIYPKLLSDFSRSLSEKYSAHSIFVTFIIDVLS